MREVNCFLLLIGVEFLTFGCNKPVATAPHDEPVANATPAVDAAPSAEKRKLQENNAFAEKQVYSTKDFRFDIPRPWYFAIADSTKKANVARCFLNSPLRVSAEGVFLIDAGKAVESIEKTIDGMSKVMKNGRDDIEIQREEVELDGNKAVCLKSGVADYKLPCAVIVIEHNGTLFLIMMSVSKTTQLGYRDSMLQTLLQTWKWKDSGADK